MSLSACTVSYKWFHFLGLATFFINKMFIFPSVQIKLSGHLGYKSIVSNKFVILEIYICLRSLLYFVLPCSLQSQLFCYYRYKKKYHRPCIPPCVMASLATEFKFGVFRVLPTTHAKTTQNKCILDLCQPCVILHIFIFT